MPSQPQSSQARNNKKARRAKQNGHQTSSVQASRDRIGAREGKAIREGTWAGPAGSWTARAAAEAAAGPGQLGSSMPRKSAETTSEVVAQAMRAYATHEAVGARISETPALAAQPELVQRFKKSDNIMLRAMSTVLRRAEQQDRVAGQRSMQTSQLSLAGTANSLVTSQSAAPTRQQTAPQFGSPGPFPAFTFTSPTPSRRHNATMHGSQQAAPARRPPSRPTLSQLNLPPILPLSPAAPRQSAGKQRAGEDAAGQERLQTAERKERVESSVPARKDALSDEELPPPALPHIGDMVRSVRVRTSTDAAGASKSAFACIERLRERIKQGEEQGEEPRMEMSASFRRMHEQTVEKNDEEWADEDDEMEERSASSSSAHDPGKWRPRIKPWVPFYQAPRAFAAPPPAQPHPPYTSSPAQSTPQPALRPPPTAPRAMRDGGAVTFDLLPNEPGRVPNEREVAWRPRFECPGPSQVPPALAAFTAF
ncbi:hypothetical protein Rhopal_005684-T1 [Rhodotorula paludigena]|uniref:Uncharacterized protein n=1 Tax=Rhodotorula paludigena TaxID=86838 RepID=A0AAV5GQ63_9BASI|nr:hypothetical protein Rhopal_005684-T1 [Rhodotorula paludigena]